MKRYRVISMDFDTRAFILSVKIEDEWEPHIKDMWHKNKRNIREGIVIQFGSSNYDQKIEDFIAIGVLPFSITAFHNKFIRQARDAFVSGGYYPCLTASCALGERILNQLIIHLRDYYKSTENYKKVYRKESFDNWDLAIETLESWKILLPEVAFLFKELRDIRNKALHFNPETDNSDRELAISAFNKIREIIEKQFGTGGQPWYFDARGATFVKKEYEENPFVIEIVIQNCNLVGYMHTLEMKGNTWIVHDDHEYDEKKLLDDEFKELYENYKIQT